MTPIHISSSLRAKLPLSILTVLLLTLSIATAFILHSADSVISYVKTSRIEETSQANGNNISVQLQRAGKDMVLAAGLPSMHQGIELTPGNNHSQAGASLVNLLGRVKMSYGYYETFALVNAEGEIIAGVSDFDRPSLDDAGKAWLKKTLSKSTFVVSSPFVSESSGNILIPVSLKVVYNGIPAVLMGTLQLDKTTRVMLREAARPGVKSLVVTGSGEVVSAVAKEDLGFGMFADKP